MEADVALHRLEQLSGIEPDSVLEDNSDFFDVGDLTSRIAV
jgi:hypothetical protein